MPTNEMPAAKTTATIRSVCRKCGTVGKSGKSSCCGRGGSWFRNCGSTKDAKHSHTWYEGIQVCNTRAQPKRASGRESNASQQQLNPSNGADMRNPKAVMTTTTFALTSGNAPKTFPDFKTFTTTPTRIISTSANTSTVTTAFMISHTGTLAMTTSATITASISTSTMITQTVIATGWISHVMYVCMYVCNKHI